MHRSRGAWLVVLALLAAACGGGGTAAPADEGGETGGGTASSAAPDAADGGSEAPSTDAAAGDLPEEIVVAGTISKTGPLAGAVTDFDVLAENFAASVNADGGLDMCGTSVPLRFEFTDDASDQAQVRRLYDEIVSSEPHLLIGPYSSPLSFAAAPAAESSQIPMVMAEANSGAIYSQGFSWVFGLLDAGATWSDNDFATLAEVPEPPTSIGFVLEDNLSNQEIYEGAKANAEEAGMEIVVDETLPGDTQDFTPVIARLRDADPDIVYISSFEPFALVFMRQALEQGVSPRLFHVAKYGAAFVEGLGEQAEGVSGEHYWLPGVEGEGTERFEQLLDETGLTAGAYPWTAIRMPAFQVIENLFETACSVDPAVLQETLRTLETPTIAGDIAFSEDGSGTLKPFPSQIQDGEFVVVGPPDQAEAEYLYPYEY